MADEKMERQKVKEITDKLEAGLKALFESEKYKSYLSTMSKFHNYSFNNTLLIAMQKPEATLVAGYKAWQKNFERHVNSGEKAIRILAPVPYKIKEERDKLDPVTGEIMLDENGLPQKEEAERTIPAFRAVSVFDVSQTDGKPLPELAEGELWKSVEGYGDFVQALMNVAPVPIGFEDIPGDAKGYYQMEEKRIAIQENMSESQTLKTMIHETAHSMLHKKEADRDDILDAPVKDRNTKEVEAESIAYTVCQHFGIDTSDYSFGYIAGWSSGKDMKELKSSLDTIRRAASELITGIEEQLQILEQERGLLQATEEQLLYGSTDKYGIYQLKKTPELDGLRFEGTESLKRMGITKYNFDAIKPENYELVYTGELKEFEGQTSGETLEAIYTKFNIDHPEDFKGHSLSVSDVVVLHQDGDNTANFVDSFGFTELPDFMRELENVPEGDTLGHDVQKSEQDTLGHNVQKSAAELQEPVNEDEIIDLGDEMEQVLSEMKQSLKPKIEETELAFQLADRYISIQTVEDGYDYSIMGADYKEIDGGVYDNPNISIREALADIVQDLKESKANVSVRGSIKAEDELQPIDYDGLMEKIEEANRIEPQSSVVEAFRAKTNEMFHDISELNASEVEETVKCHVQAKIDEYGIDAVIVDAVVTGSRCRGLEKEGSDLDVVVELSTQGREDDLFNAFNEDGLHIGNVRVDINPITAQRTGTLETYLPQAEEYLAGVKAAREQMIEQLPDMEARDSLEKRMPEKKAPKEERKKEQDIEKPSLKARLAQKQAQVSGGHRWQKNKVQKCKEFSK